MNNAKKKLVFAAVYIALSLLIIRVSQLLIIRLFTNGFAAGLVSEILFAVLAVVGSVLFGKTDGLKLRGKGFREGMLAGLLFLIAFPLIMLFALIAGLAVVTEPAGNIVMFVIQMLFVGIAEEVMFRNVLQNVAMEVTGEDSAAAARKGILLAGMVFGLVHLTNIFAGVTVIGAVVQAFMAIPMGIVLGTIYFRGCNNLLPVILIHAVTDAVSFITTGALSGTALTDAITGVSLGGGPAGKAAAFMFYVVLALFLMRKSKIEKAIEARSTAA